MEGNVQIAKLVDMDNPDAVFAEVKAIFRSIFPDEEFRSIANVFEDVKRLFKGDFPGYQKCNTEYHDLKHTTDCFLSMARLLHGAMVEWRAFTLENVKLGLIAALFHDTGFIQKEDDTAGTGAKYTLVHVDRSIKFMESYLQEHGYPKEAIGKAPKIVRCTSLNVDLSRIKFQSAQVKTIGQMLGAADLLGQIADRTYLEKLLFLYYEFKEGGVIGYESELDLLKKTLKFYDITTRRFKIEFRAVYEYARAHFRSRWGIDRNLYIEANQRQIEYLRSVVVKDEKHYRDMLRRGEIVKWVREKYDGEG